MVVSGQEILFTADEVELNASVDGGIFELPAEIRSLPEPRL
jgi:hypothetical protein